MFIFKKSVYYSGLLVIVLLAAGSPVLAHVTLNSPNGGEVFSAGSETTIEWQVAIEHGLINWDLYYSTTGDGGPWIQIALDLPPGDPGAGSLHSYTWTVPNVATTQAVVQIYMDNSGADYRDFSDDDFTIEASSATDTSFIDIDMTKKSYGNKNGGRGFTGAIPAIVFRNNLTTENFFWAMTLDPITGVQQGDRLEIALGDAGKPVAVLYSEHFIPDNVIILDQDQTLTTFPVTIGEDGTPSAGAVSAVDPMDNGSAVSFSEVSGLAFPDGYPRLFIGTVEGKLVKLVNDPIDGILLEDLGTFSIDPIDAMKVIPQYQYLTLGILTGGVLYGIDPKINGKNSGSSSRWTSMYSLADPRPSPSNAFAVFEPNHEPLTDPDATVKLVLANGANELALAELTATLEGDGSLVLVTDSKVDPVSRVATGSLLMLLSDGSAVMYDPGYSEDTGSSDCEINITDDINDICAYICGDANGNEAVNILDITFLIAYLYKGGPAPEPLESADANGDGNVNILDITYLIAYLYKGGPAPIC